MQFLKSLLLIITIFFSANDIKAQEGTVDTSPAIKSEILKREMHYSVYLPEGYHQSVREYPVLYLLHGMWGDSRDWVIKGEINRIASNLMADGSVPEMIIIMPDGLTDAFYINNYDKSVRWNDFFYEEFIPQVEKKFRILKDKNNRAIAGLSMGGYGALYHAISHKAMFKACYALSAAVLEVEPSTEESQTNGSGSNFNAKLWGPLNNEGLPANYKKHSIQEIIKEMDTYKAPNPFGPGSEDIMPAITLDCGDDDFLLKQNINLANIFKSKNIPFELRIRDGGHTWEYWRTGIALGLEFIGNAFRN